MTLFRQVIEPGNPAVDPSRKFNLPLSPAVRGGDFVFLSAMAAIDPATGERVWLIVPANAAAPADAAEVARFPSAVLYRR